jgi:hypothetical protein
MNSAMAPVPIKSRVIVVALFFIADTSLIDGQNESRAACVPKADTTNSGG